MHYKFNGSKSIVLPLFPNSYLHSLQNNPEMLHNRFQGVTERNNNVIFPYRLEFIMSLGGYLSTFRRTRSDLC